MGYIVWYEKRSCLAIFDFSQRNTTMIKVFKNQAEIDAFEKEHWYDMPDVQVRTYKGEFPCYIDTDLGDSCREGRTMYYKAIPEFVEAFNDVCRKKAIEKVNEKKKSMNARSP
jgi:hypothetical protein